MTNPTTPTGEKPSELEVVARMLENFARENAREESILPMMPRSDESWAGFKADARKIIEALPRTQPTGEKPSELRSDVINAALAKISELTGEDFHGYRSEVYSAIGIAVDSAPRAPSQPTGQPTGEGEDLACPFCGEGDFDLEGLKGHIQNNDCVECASLPVQTRMFAASRPSTEVPADSVNHIWVRAIQLLEHEIALEQAVRTIGPHTEKVVNVHNTMLRLRELKKEKMPDADSVVVGRAVLQKAYDYLCVNRENNARSINWESDGIKKLLTDLEQLLAKEGGA